jgi:hypothetical protein
VVCVFVDAESPTSSRASDLVVFRITLRLRRNLAPGAARKPIETDFGALKLSRLQTSVHFLTCKNISNEERLPSTTLSISLSGGEETNQDFLSP